MPAKPQVGDDGKNTGGNPVEPLHVEQTHENNGSAQNPPPPAKPQVGDDGKNTGGNPVEPPNVGPGESGRNPGEDQAPPAEEEDIGPQSPSQNDGDPKIDENTPFKFKDHWWYWDDRPDP